MAKRRKDESPKRQALCEMDEDLGYSKYDFRNKETDNTRNGYNTKQRLVLLNNSKNSFIIQAWTRIKFNDLAHM